MTSARAARPIETYTSFRSPDTEPAISKPIATATTETIAPNRITEGSVGLVQRSQPIVLPTVVLACV
jgi:hypothetical protein